MAFQKIPLVIAIHGGCDAPAQLSLQAQESNHQALKESLEAGYEILENGGSSVDAVVKAVQVMEDSDFFNAGKTSVYNVDGDVEMDAGVSDGFCGTSGAVGSVKNVKNPVELARCVMTNTPHACIVGEGARRLAAIYPEKIKMSNDEYFKNIEKQKQLDFVLQSTNGLPAVAFHDDYFNDRNQKQSPIATDTVGAVAIDRDGHLATASSTGGLIGKMTGRVGDAAINGCGFWADKKIAIVATGNGDLCVNVAACHAVASKHQELLQSHLAESKETQTILKEACQSVLEHQLAADYAGFVAIDKEGNISMPYNTPGMYRGYMHSDTKKAHTYIHS